ncbi:MAG: hypothetical protein IJK24_06970 [Oscillospiraceae bacterium]|nr:hypothetical protein [Oscillospiraceae bacterium]
MLYSNACRGLKNIRRSIVITVAGLLVYLMSRLFLLRSGYLSETAEGILAAVELLASVAAAVLQILGLFQAAKDEDAFKAALAVSLLSFLTELSIVFLDRESKAARVLSLMSIAASMLCLLMILRGVRNLAQRLENPVLVKQSRRLGILTLITTGLGMLLVLAGGAAETDAELFLLLLFFIVVMVLCGLLAFRVIRYLREAVKMLDFHRAKMMSVSWIHNRKQI